MMVTDMIEIDISIAQKTNQEIGKLFWDKVEKAFAEEIDPDIFLQAKDADFNPDGLKYLRKQILRLGQIQQAGRMIH